MTDAVRILPPMPGRSKEVEPILHALPEWFGMEDSLVEFYRSMGFAPLEVFPELWDPWNPCLTLVKIL